MMGTFTVETRVAKLYPVVLMQLPDGSYVVDYRPSAPAEVYEIEPLVGDS